MSADVTLSLPERRRLRLPAMPASIAAASLWILLMVAVALCAHWLQPYTITQMDLSARLQPPVLFGGAWAHPLGTDQLGRDVLSRLIVSIRVSLTLAFCATLLGVAFGALMGLAAAHFRGPVEQVVLVLIDVQAALPFIILALSALAFFGNSWTLLVFLLAFYGWERHARVVRGLAMAANGQGYMMAVRQLGAGPGRLYARHLLPNIAATLVVSATLAFPEVILAASGLSFLGLGIQPPNTSLGNMVGYGRSYLSTAPWVLLAPAVVIVLTTLSISLLGDWLRDQLDTSGR
ncbi:ABC transporter permease [Pseudooceanicola sp. CBS1P-1]|uniref:ABC transporter permease subunit n=1 Tax=Pseudooceanicola albus TaxID=2692189 RepID=A0A6L7FZL0_9RHOB|nr:MULTISPECIES: ABC transporter permease [Pseudooceanicola]MBT9382330.1 ABC transporter permease [Pseudooceanicola endophyticus]MXN16872.1 ABC transporter permease subunit [Pseudooceanicola albus]